MTKQEILETIDTLTSLDKDSYQELPYTDLEVATEKAVLVGERWIPKSQLKCDFDENLYITNWLFDKLQQGGE